MLNFNNIKNLITSGCSFSAGEIPLDRLSKGSNSGYYTGSVWPHFFFAGLDNTDGKLVNLAMPGAGNIAAMSDLVYYLETTRPSVNDTLIGFNITGLNRLDLITTLDETHNVNLCCIDPKGIQHHSESFGFGWNTMGNKHKFYAIDILSSLSVLQIFNYLENNGYHYFFMFMNNEIYHNAPEFFKSAIDKRLDKCVEFNNDFGMYEFAKKNQMVTSDGHPTINGHKLIASHITTYIKSYA